MRLLRFHTVRAKLIATTMLVMGLLLGVLGVVADVSSRQALMGSVEEDLRKRADDFATVRGRRPMGPPPSFGNGFGFFDRDKNDRPFMRRKRDSQWIAPALIFVTDKPDLATIQSEAYDVASFWKSAKGARVYSWQRVDGDLRRVFSVPVRQEGKIHAVVQVATSVTDVMTALDNLRDTLVRVVIPVGLVLGGLASFFVVGRLLSPLRSITEDAERIREQGFGERLVPLGTDEFAHLATTLNGTLDRLEEVYRLEQETTQKLARTVEQQRRFTSDASHELKTPLAVIKANAGIALHGANLDADSRELIEAIDVAATRMNALVRDLLVLARADAGRAIPDVRPCDLREILRQAARCVPNGAERVRVEMPADPVIVCASPESLCRVFVNLLDNGIKHSGSSDPVRMSLSVASSAVVEVADRGRGIAPEHLPHLFERFYRIDDSRTSDTGGTGLGLAICESIVTAHQGKISVESSLGSGTTFRVELPLVETSEED